MSNLDLIVPVALGVGLAAATGCRVFLPMLVVSYAAYSGYLPLGESFRWLAMPSALIMLGVAALVETLAYYIPGVDNLTRYISHTRSDRRRHSALSGCHD